MINVKVEAIKRKMKLTELVQKLSKKRGEPVCYYSITQRIKKGTLKQHELEEIFEILGCELMVVDTDKNQKCS